MRRPSYQDLARLPDAEAVAVAVAVAVGSRSLASTERFAVWHRIERAHGSWTELAADPEVRGRVRRHPANHTAADLCTAAGKAVT